MNELIGWIVALVAVVAGFIISHFGGKARQRQESESKVNEQSANAAKVVRDVQDENQRLPPGAAADILRDRWGVRDKTPTGRQ